MKSASFAANPEVVRVSLNENPFGPSPKVAVAIAAEQGRLHRYVDQSDLDRLTSQIAKLEGVSVEHVVVGELLDSLGRYLAMQNNGGEVVFSSPGYTALADAAAAFGGRSVPVPLDASFRNDLAKLAEAVTEKTSAVFLVNPHNPSGTVNDMQEFDAFLKKISSKALTIVDEAYLEYDDFNARSAVRLLREGANILVFRTLTKIYGLGGLSIGYLLAPPTFAKQLRQAGFGDARSLNRLSLVAAEAALSDQDYIAQVKKKTIDGRSALTAALDRLKLKHTDSRANFVFFESPKPFADVRSELLTQGIAIGRAHPPLNNWVRVTIGTAEENGRVIEALRKIF